VEELLGLVIRAHATQCCHDAGIAMHAAKLIQPLNTQTFSNQMIGAKGED
jgi:hypothetical protein